MKDQPNYKRSFLNLFYQGSTEIEMGIFYTLTHMGIHHLIWSKSDSSKLRFRQNPYQDIWSRYRSVRSLQGVFDLIQT